ncbi:endolytic transglycosylase MltG [Acidihalobacter ferrooxydans]|uniref:Endolytic murein transglycosylase n=1 Tax=Acidihalobacter ferrooxydans TaxID=1765967 RepID=A0A1P8UII5_9GAMM|nr:endolytic transglycosylase MltG [Acidihalobacter ferrooxydans]APZ43646.1 hypothetical protein BW247_11565 [Acidihalobacter ferrooxydans]
MRRLLGLLALFAVLAVVLVGVGVWRTLDAPLDIPAGGVLITVPSGAAAGDVALQLQRENVLQHPRLWTLYARLDGRAGQIKQGEYRLNPGLTSLGLLDLLVAGKTVQYPLTLIDGWTFRQIMQALNKDPHIDHTLKPTDYADLIHRLGGPKNMSPEGWFYPNTYFFPDGATDVSILRRAYDAMRKYLDAQWAQRASNLPLKTPYQALILASIVEKETGSASERPLIAGVFINRLRKGMRLQSDPTVIYAVGRAYKGRITYRDLRNGSPYNTYVHHGLPPTPIAIPSPAAIHAVLHPAHTKYLYFVAMGNGMHAFSRTYAEQERAVIKYQLDGKTPAREK